MTISQLWRSHSNDSELMPVGCNPLGRAATINAVQTLNKFNSIPALYQVAIARQLRVEWRYDMIDCDKLNLQ